MRCCARTSSIEAQTFTYLVVDEMTSEWPALSKLFHAAASHVLDLVKLSALHSPTGLSDRALRTSALFIPLISLSNRSCSLRFCCPYTCRLPHWHYYAVWEVIRGPPKKVDQDAEPPARNALIKTTKSPIRSELRLFRRLDKEGRGFDNNRPV